MKRTRSMTSHGQSVRPGMKRDQTVIIADDDDRASESSAKKARVPQRTTTKGKLDKTDTAPFIPKLERKATSVVNDGIMTSAVELESGSHFGRMSSLDAPALAERMQVVQVPKSILKKAPSTAAAAVSHLEYIAPYIITQPHLVPHTGYTAAPPGMATPPAPGPSYKRTQTMERRDQRTAHLMSNIIPQLPQYQPPTVEVVFSFDTTGSMYGSLLAVRSQIKQMVRDLQTEMPGIRIGIIAHGDYFDADKYIVKWINFGASLQEIDQFVHNVEQTNGGDDDECYELVMKTVQHVFSWSPQTSKILVMIGDAAPHEPGYVPGYSINWRDECQNLANMGVKIFSLQVGDWKIPFYQYIASMTGGLHFHLRDFKSLHHYLLSVCHSACGEAQLRRFQERNKEIVNNSALFHQLLLSTMAKMIAPVQKPTPLTKKKTVRIRDPRLAPRQQERAVEAKSSSSAPNLQLRRSASGRIANRPSNKAEEQSKEAPTPLAKLKLTRTKSGRLTKQNQSRSAVDNATTKPISPLARFKLARTRSGRLTNQKPDTVAGKSPLEKMKLTRTRSGRFTGQKQDSVVYKSPLEKMKLTRTRSGRLTTQKPDTAAYKSPLEKMNLTRTTSVRFTGQKQKTEGYKSPLEKMNLTRTTSVRFTGQKQKTEGYKSPLEKMKLTRTKSGRLTSAVAPTSSQTTTAETDGQSTSETDHTTKVEEKRIKTLVDKFKLTRTKSGRFVSNSQTGTKKPIPEKKKPIPEKKKPIPEKKKPSTQMTDVTPSRKEKFMKKKRENVPYYDFLLRVPGDILTVISPWRVLIKPEEKKKGAKSLKLKTWKKEDWAGGLCYRGVFKKKELERPSLYEIAVQDGRKFHIVYWRVVKAIPKSRTIYTYLLNNKKIRSKVKANIKKGYVIHIKRYMIRDYAKNEASLRAALFENFDYAWVNRGSQVRRKVEGNRQVS